MNQQQALTKLKKVLGPKMGYQVNPKALKAEERAAASEQIRAVNQKKREVEAAMTARREELLGDPAYQALKAELDALQKKGGALMGKAYTKPITVGVMGGVCFHVRADGDTWSEVVAKVAGE
jgi:hypothetical protein